MNGKAAKALRKTIYGNFSHRDNTGYTQDANGDFVCVSDRRKAYQAAKKKR